MMVAPTHADPVRNATVAGDESTADKFALIGAGPAGLAMARNLMRLGIAFDGFELHDDVGGLWDIEAPHSTMYHSAHLISSKRMTEFTEFPMRDDVADYPPHRELKKYFRDFADAFDLRRNYRFATEVVRCEPAMGRPGWHVTYRDRGVGGDSRPEDGEREVTSYYRGLLIANGTLAEPNLVTFPGSFSGEIMHSSKYRSPEIFLGKRVLIVGAGNSGCDIAVDAVHFGVSTDISMRRGYHFVPKYVFGRPADSVGGAFTLPTPIKRRVDQLILRWFVGDAQRLGFPTPDHALYESHPIVNSLILYHAGHGDLSVRPDIARLDGNTVHFKDGSTADYDIIVTATGYKLHYPFIDKAHLNWQGDAPHLYLNCFHPERDDIFVLGMVEAAGLGWQGRYEQAELVARYIRACDQNSATADKFRQIKSGPFDDMRGGMNYVKLSRMAYYVHKDTFRRSVRRHIAEM